MIEDMTEEEEIGDVEDTMTMIEGREETEEEEEIIGMTEMTDMIGTKKRSVLEIKFLEPCSFFFVLYFCE